MIIVTIKLLIKATRTIAITVETRDVQDAESSYL